MYTNVSNKKKKKRVHTENPPCISLLDYNLHYVKTTLVDQMCNGKEGFF